MFKVGKINPQRQMYIRPLRNVNFDGYQISKKEPCRHFSIGDILMFDVNDRYEAYNIRTMDQLSERELNDLYYSFIPDDLKEEFVEQSIDHIGADILKNYPHLINQFPDRMFIENKHLLYQVDEEKRWDILLRNECVDDLYWFENLEADLEPDRAYQLISLLGKRVYDLEVWKHLTSSCKIMALVTKTDLSDHYPTYDQLKEIGVYESKQDNYDKNLILAAIKFYLLKFCTQRNEQIFTSAEETLNEYISEQLLTDEKISHAACVFFDKCVFEGYGFQFSDDPYFCDIKEWEDEKCFFCSRGKHHAYSRNKCELKKYTTIASMTRKPQLKSFADLWNSIGVKTVVGEGYTENNYPYKKDAYMNKIIKYRPHMYCESCGSRLLGNAVYSKKGDATDSLTVLNCKQMKSDACDHNVYMSYCWNCEEVIDSRECNFKDKGFYICMRCGAGKKIKGSKIHGQFCPNCGKAISPDIYLNFMKTYMTCPHCGHDGSKWKSRFENS